jgi:hypothetical protein
MSTTPNPIITQTPDSETNPLRIASTATQWVAAGATPAGGISFDAQYEGL